MSKNYMQVCTCSNGVTLDPACPVHGMIIPPITTTYCSDCEKLKQRVKELEGKLATTVRWLEIHKPDVFREGIWDALNGK